MREPRATSDAAASSHSGEKPNAAIDPISTTLPAAFRFGSCAGSGSCSAAARLAVVDAADQLDQDAQRVLRRRFVEPRAAHESWHDELGGLVHRAADHRHDRANQTLGQRGDEREATTHG